MMLQALQKAIIVRITNMIRKLVIPYETDHRIKYESNKYYDNHKRV